MSIDITSGPAEVIASGEVTGFGGASIVWRLQIDEEPLRLVMSFQSDPDREGIAVDTQWLDDGLELVLVNFDSAEGRGSARPVLLAERQDDLFFLHFRVFRFGQTEDRTVHYSFYRVRKEAVGWAAG